MSLIVLFQTFLCFKFNRMKNNNVSTKFTTGIAFPNAVEETLSFMKLIYATVDNIIYLRVTFQDIFIAVTNLKVQ